MDIVNILIATNSHKDFASSKQIGESLKEGLSSVKGNIQIKILPIGDGGEGTIEALISSKNGYVKNCRVHDGLFGEKEAGIGLYNDGVKTAVIEIAQASGSSILLPEERNTMIATSYGTGELILSAMDEGCDRIIIGLGGSIVSDGGMGMAQALGAVFLDKDGKRLVPVNNKGFNVLSLLFISDIDLPGLDTRISNKEIIAAADVRTRLLGPLGQARTFGPQKGATPAQIEFIESSLSNWNEVLKKTFGRDFNVNYSGAAGGLGSGISAFLNGKLELGIERILKEIGFKALLEWADVVVTGEGKLDSTSLQGKGSLVIARKVKKFGKKVIGVFGIIEDSHYELTNLYDHVIIANKDGMDVNEVEFKRTIGYQQIKEAGIALAKYFS
ncbi:MAG: glycerate kinase [Thermoplasmata archaeon]|nr:MAG: glycerate kinase [Thermoplasmata archaeon]